MNVRSIEFSQMVLVHFGWLQERGHHFRVSHGGEHQVVFDSRFCQVAVSLERGDLFVELASNESEPIRRIKFSLNELLAVSAVALGHQAIPVNAKSPDLSERLRVAAASLAEYGSEVLTGDFSVRTRIVKVQVRAWLEAKYQDVMVKRRYAAIEQGFRQAAWELARQSEEKKGEAYQQLDEWMSLGTAQQREFAEKVLDYP